MVKVTFGCFHHPQQPPVCDFFTPSEPQNYQLLQVCGYRAHRQVGHIDTWRQVQLVESIPKKLGERENWKILKREEEGAILFLCVSTQTHLHMSCADTCHVQTHVTDPNVGAALQVERLQLCSGCTGSRQTFHYLCSADVHTLRQIQTPQGRHGQKVSEACGWQEIITLNHNYIIYLASLAKCSSQFS